MEFINAVKSKEKGKIDDALKSFLNAVTVSIINFYVVYNIIISINLFFYQIRMPIHLYLMSSTT
jgi:hypothetical protein